MNNDTTWRNLITLGHQIKAREYYYRLLCVIKIFKISNGSNNTEAIELQCLIV